MTDGATERGAMTSDRPSSDYRSLGLITIDTWPCESGDTFQQLSTEL